MKFFIKDDPISYNELYAAIAGYVKDNYGKRPSYMLVHPETRHKILISSRDESHGIQFHAIQVVPQKVEKELKEVQTVFGVYLLVSPDIEPGFVILCG